MPRGTFVLSHLMMVLAPFPVKLSMKSLWMPSSICTSTRSRSEWGVLIYWAFSEFTGLSFYGLSNISLILCEYCEYGTVKSNWSVSECYCRWTAKGDEWRDEGASEWTSSSILYELYCLHIHKNILRTANSIIALCFAFWFAAATAHWVTEWSSQQ